MMPEVKGNELADAVKEANPATGVILMSGYLDRDGEAIKNSKSIDFFLSKPIELSKLSEAVKKALRSR
jgi:FixJ family two-component response regulator